MPLILAVDRDRRQVTQLVSLVHKKLNAELVQATSAEEALKALGGRIPDLILTSSLISPREDSVLAGHLRELGHRAAHVQTLTIPVLKASRPRRSKSGVLSKLRRESTKASSAPEGCDPEMFAEEIGLYLARAAEEQQMRATRETAATKSQAAPPEAPAIEETVPAEVAEFLEVEDAPAAETIDVASADEATTLVAQSIGALAETATDDDATAPLSELVSSAEERVEAYSTPLYQPVRAIDDHRRAEEQVSESDDDFGGFRDVRDLSYSVDDFDAVTPDLTLAPRDLPVQEVEDATVTGFEDGTVSGFEDAIGRDLPDEVAPIRAEAVHEDWQHDAPAAAEPASSAVSIDRLVALFADLAPRSIEVFEPTDAVQVVEPEPDEAPMVAAIEVVEPDAIAEAVESPGAVEAISPEDRAVTSTPATTVFPPPALDEEALVKLGEAAWKASFRAAFLKDLGLGPARDASSERKGEAKVDASKKANAPTPVEEQEPSESAPADASSSAEAAARKDSKDSKEGKESKESKEARAKKKPKRPTKNPAQDEWGLFDPDQCGFSALVDKLDEVTDTPEEQPRAGTRVRVISY